MRRKITHVILLPLLISVIMTVITGCGKNSGTENEKDPPEEGSFIEALPEEAKDTQITPSGETELDWTTLEENLRPSILQIMCGGYKGSGVVWEITEEEVTVISCGHLLKNAETCDVVCYAGIYYEAEVERVLEDCDIGFAVFSSEALKEDGVELKEAVLCGREKDQLVAGEELAVYGSMDHVAGNFVKGYLIEAEKEMQIEGYGSGGEFLLGGIIQGNTEEGIVDAGMSGSGVFDRQGRLLGILAGGDGKEGFAAVPVWKFVE